MLAMAASAEETNRQSNAGRRSVISPSEAPPEAEQSDVYQTPPPGLKEWLFILILCSTQLFRSRRLRIHPHSLAYRGANLRSGPVRGHPDDLACGRL